VAVVSNPLSEMKSTLAASVIAAAVASAAAGACTSDEQVALGDPQNVGKKANDCGTSSYNIFTGKFNHGKFNDCFSASAGISATCAECYAATGEYGAKNCKADCLLGWCKSGCLSCTEPAQETLATCTGFNSGTAQPCDQVTEQVTAGACTSDEQAALGDPQNVGKKANDCGTSSYNIFTGKFNHGKFNDCFSASAGISATCAECYAATGEYGAKNCKADCLLGWCKSGCLSCTEPAQETLATCTGFNSGTAQPCDQVTEQVTAGACTSDEQAALGDPQNVGKKANDCGTSSYNIFTGKFNHGKFNDCFSASAGISATCAECYAATGEYGAKNCKADCLLGWCKSGCLSCTEPAQETLVTCTGFASGTAQPCDEVTV